MTHNTVEQIAAEAKAMGLPIEIRPGPAEITVGGYTFLTDPDPVRLILRPTNGSATEEEPEHHRYQAGFFPQFVGDPIRAQVQINPAWVNASHEYDPETGALFERAIRDKLVAMSQKDIQDACRGAVATVQKPLQFEPVGGTCAHCQAPAGGTGICHKCYLEQHGHE